MALWTSGDEMVIAWLTDFPMRITMRPYRAHYNAQWAAARDPIILASRAFVPLSFRHHLLFYDHSGDCSRDGEVLFRLARGVQLEGSKW